jgi:hypothetical protein
MPSPCNNTPRLAAAFAVIALAASSGSVAAKDSGPPLNPRADGARSIAASARGAGKPERLVSRVNHTVEIPAGTSWNSAVRFGENCSFDLTAEFDETFTVWVFDDHELIQIEISDIYTNRSTGFTFRDRARYSIRFDYATNLAFHEGIFWQVNVAGSGIEVLDVGTFVQDWSGSFPWPILSLTGEHHDVNAQPFGTHSYCDWAQGMFP